MNRLGIDIPKGAIVETEIPDCACGSLRFYVRGGFGLLTMTNGTMIAAECVRCSNPCRIETTIKCIAHEPDCSCDVGRPWCPSRDPKEVRP